jgi:hypothetical protein
VTSDVEMLGCGVGPTLHDFTHDFLQASHASSPRPERHECQLNRLDKACLSKCISQRTSMVSHLGFTIAKW